MYTDIFRFNLSNYIRNIIIIVILRILLQKCVMRTRKIRIRISINYAITVIILRLIIAVIPNRLTIQGGINFWFIIFLGLIFRILRNWSRIRYYKITPPSPVIIIPIIIIIELIRNLIRPISLILRVLINLTIGHIVIYILTFPLSIFYNLVEIFIYSIQIYIFWTLILIYSK